MIVTVSNTGVTATSGKFNNFATVIPTNEVALLVTTTNSFQDARESKNRPAGGHQCWQSHPLESDQSLFASRLASNSVASVYVLDRRTLSGTNLPAVRREWNRAPESGAHHCDRPSSIRFGAFQSDECVKSVNLQYDHYASVFAGRGRGHDSIGELEGC